MNQEEIYYPDNLEQCQKGYTYERVLNEVCKGNEVLAKAIWACRGGAFPETMLQEWMDEGEVVEYNNRYYFVYNDEQYNELCSLNESTDEYKEAILNADEFREQEGLFVKEIFYEENVNWVEVVKICEQIKDIYQKGYYKVSNYDILAYIAEPVIDAFKMQFKFPRIANKAAYDAFKREFENAYERISFGVFEGRSILLKDLKPCLLLSNDGEGYQEYLLAANKISPNNGFHLVVNKNGEPEIGGAMIIQDTEDVRNILDNVPKSKQYDVMIQLRHPEYAQLYWSK